MNIKFVSLMLITILCNTHAETFTIKRQKKSQQIRVIKEQCCEQLVQLMKFSPTLLKHIAQEPKKRTEMKDNAQHIVFSTLIADIAQIQEIAISILNDYWDGEVLAFGCCKLYPEFSQLTGDLETIYAQFQKIDSLLTKDSQLTLIKNEQLSLHNSLKILEKRISKGI